MPGALDWRTEVLPVLEAAYGLIGSSAGFADAGEVDTDSLNGALGRDRHDPRTSVVLRHLVSGGYIRTVYETDQVPEPSVFAFEDRALQLVAGWPTSSGEAALEKLLAVLDERIATAPDGEHRGRLVKFRDGVLAAGREVAVGVLTGVLSPGGPVM
jgi:hypothetical protein